MAVVGRETDGALYAIGRTSPLGGYSGFAKLRLIHGSTELGQPIYIDTETDYEVKFSTIASHPAVTWFTAEKRREVLGMMARFPKRFERCEIVRVDSLKGYGSPVTDALEGDVKEALEPEPVHHGSQGLDTATRCKLATTLSRTSRTDLWELIRFTEFLGHKKEARTGEPTQPSETAAMIRAEWDRRSRLAKEALERIWLEPLGEITYGPAPAGAARGTKPQPGDE